ncbi:MAG: NAD(P)-binding domain-containing protein [Actinomycetota bacterium]|nr:NAD(P)-binding domain-containing protein [Actinomycetota bacterium]
MPTIAFLGFGELGTSLAGGLARSGRHVLRAYARSHANPTPAIEQRLRSAGTELCTTLAAAVEGADAILAAVPGSASVALAALCAPHVKHGALYVDFSSSAPEDKRRCELSLAVADALYVDAAVLGTVAVSGPEVPILAAGPGAGELVAMVTSDGLRVTAIDAPTGQAALVKLLRSIYLKGRDALIVEMMLVTRRYGLEELVASSIGGPGETVAFSALAERVLRGVALHAERRAQELAVACELAERVGVEPSLARAGVQRLDDLARLGLGQRLGDAEHLRGAAVLKAIDELSPQGPQPKRR